MNWERIYRAVRYCPAVLLGLMSSAARLAATSTPTTIPTPSPTPFICDGVEFPQPVLEFDFSIEPPQPVVGDPVTVTVTIRNITGGFVGRPLASLSSSVPILSGNMFAGPFHWTPVRFELLALQPGATALNVSVTYEAKTGCCGYCFTPGGQRSPPFTLHIGGGEPLPDLVPSEVIVGPVDVPACVVDLANYIEHNPIPAGVCVRNVGGAAAGAFVVAKDDSTVLVDGLDAGASMCVPGFLHAADVPTALVRVDADEQVVEREEDNNERLLHVPLPSLPPVCGTRTPTPIPSVAPESSCPGDCDANGRVQIDELVRGVNMALADDLVEGCLAFDADRDGRVAVNELVGAVDAALRGCAPETRPSPSLTPTLHEDPMPTPTNPPGSCCCGHYAFIECQAAARDGSCIGWSDPCPATAMPTSSQTPVPTPTATPIEAVSLAHQVFTQIAPRVCLTGITPGGIVSVEATPSGAVLRCESFTGHRGTVTIRGFPRAEDALLAFGPNKADSVTVDVGGGPLRIRSLVPPCCPGGLAQTWAWLEGCWLVVGDAFDDTGYRLAPQPRAVVEEILQSPQAVDLFSSCVAG